MEAKGQGRELGLDASGRLSYVLALLDNCVKTGLFMHSLAPPPSRLSSLSSQAYQIWKAGVDAVSPRCLIKEHFSVSSDRVELGDRSFALKDLGRILVVGAGKAGAEMASAIEAEIPEELLPKLRGWVNVPEDCVRKLKRIHLHAARPAGSNRPCQAGVEGTQKILSLLEELQAEDLCIVLLSGGGSALLTAPPPGISVEQKLSLIDLLESAGSDIVELNTVRKQFSLVKGGRLAQRLTPCPTVSLIISDVVGDPLDIIASGPTVEDTSRPSDAIEILSRRLAEATPSWAIEHLQSAASDRAQEISPTLSNMLIGSNSVALDAAARKARELGFHVLSLGAENTEDVERHAEELLQVLLSTVEAPDARASCVLSGGEPSVKLADKSVRGKGGRNQQLALHLLELLLEQKFPAQFSVVSAGTDGEDGPTDAAGAVIDPDSVRAAEQVSESVREYLARNDAYTFLSKINALLKTGPTNTNVMDLRVAIWRWRAK